MASCSLLLNVLILGQPPRLLKASSKKNEGGGNIIAMMDQMIKDVEMDIQEGKHDEEYAQKDYEREMKDAATKRSDDSKLMVEKNGAKADEQTNAQSVLQSAPLSAISSTLH